MTYLFINLNFNVSNSGFYCLLCFYFGLCFYFAKSIWNVFTMKRITSLIAAFGLFIWPAAKKTVLPADIPFISVLRLFKSINGQSRWTLIP